jgi:hypothetical protein
MVATAGGCHHFGFVCLQSHRVCAPVVTAGGCWSVCVWASSPGRPM